MDFSLWLSSLGEVAQSVLDAGYEYVPRVVAATIILVVGWLVGRALRFVTVRVLKRLLRLLPARARAEEAGDVERVALRIVGGLVFWLVFLVSAGVASEVVALNAMTAVLARLAEYLPSIIGAVLVIAAGILLGNVAASWITSASRSMNIAYGPTMARAAKVVILLVASVVALAEAGIDSTLLVVAVGIILGAFLGAAALAFGLGARTTVANIIAAHYLQRSYRINQRVRIGEHEGRILELRPTGVVLETADGVTLVPAKRFSEETSVLVHEAGS